MADWPYNTAAWSRLRRAKLSVNPMCEVCVRRGLTVLARAVDHKVSIKSGGAAFPSLMELMSMCLSCHAYKTMHEDHPDNRRKIGSAFKGCAVDGGSLDDDEWGSA